MKIFAILGLLAMVAPMMAQAAETSCAAIAQDKKLAGAAKTSFMTRCRTDTVARCEQAAADRKLYGAAKNSFVGKCTTDGVGT